MSPASSTVSDAPAIVWFRDDLRVADNPALAAAAGSGRPVIALFVLDEESAGLRPRGGASRWWLAGSLRALDRSLRERGLPLTLRRGPAAHVLARLAAATGAAAVYWNRRYEPSGAAVDQAVAADLSACGVAAKTFQASLLFEPQAVQTRSGAPFAVFTPFLRHVLALPEPRTPLPAPDRIRSAGGVASERLDDWALEPSAPDWAAKFNDHWTRGEAAACEKLAAFADGALADYAAQRDRPGGPHTSRLSPHLRFGEISPFQLWHAIRHAREAAAPRSIAASADKFVSELVWREFCHHLLAHHPDLAVRNVQPRFDDFPWRSDDAALNAWRRGETGYPIVDAGMRRIVGDRLDAQPRAPGYRVVPDQASPHRLARRRALVLGHAARRRSRQQSRELAMGRGLRRRRRALFPHLQPGAAGGEIRRGGRVCAALGS